MKVLERGSVRPYQHPAARRLHLGVRRQPLRSPRRAIAFRIFTWERDDVLADITSTLGLPPWRCWDAWAYRGEFFEENGGWREGGIKSRIYDPVWRPLSRRIWDMGRGGEEGEGCEW